MTLTTLFPLYFIALAGFVAGRVLKIEAKQLSTLVIYLLVPITFLGGVAVLPNVHTYLWVLPAMFVLASCMATFMYHTAGHLFTDTRRNLLAQASGTANTGYFGLPIFAAMAGADAPIGAYILGIIGVSICESTVCYYFLSRGQFSPRDSFMRLFKLPVIYACLGGLLLNIMLPDAAKAIVSATLTPFRGAYVVCGMMLVGIGLSTIQHWRVDWRFTAVLFVQKFLLWPLLMAGVLLLDIHILHFGNPTGHLILAILATVPLAANSVAFAAQLGVHPEKMALAVLLSTVVALITMPITLPLLLGIR
jgi:malate permease and related proteins